MIFKIEMNYDDLIGVIDLFKDKYDILFCQNLYISERKKTKGNSCAKIKKKMKEYPNSLVITIDEFNLASQPIQVQTWCRDKFVEQDLIEFENNEQEQIKNMMDIIHNFDNELENILRIKRDGGEKDGRRNEEKKRDTSKEET